MPRLRIEKGKGSGKTVDLTKPTIIGRGDTAQLRIGDNHASREHCKVFEQAGAWVVADLNSSNGTKVDGVKITRRNLNPGDKIEIGETFIVFEATAATTPAKSGASPAAAAKKQEAFAAARAASAAPKRASASAVATKRSGGDDSGLKVSDRVLQFSKVDVKKATVLDIDLSQSAGMSRLVITLACVAFLGGAIWLVVKLVA